MIQTPLPQDIVFCDYETYLKRCEDLSENPYRNPLMYFF